MTKKILLIDVPNLFYRAFFAIPKTLTSPEGEPTNAVFGTASTILSLFENEKPDFIFGFRDRREKTFRHEKDENYKAQRPDMPDELSSQMPKIDDLFHAFNIPVYSKIGYEADDCIATVAKKFEQDSDFEVYIVSGDHDLFGLVHDNIFVLKPVNGGKLEKMTREKVKEKLKVYPEQVADFKAISGDTSDNLPGIPGIGPKGASDMLNEYGTLEKILENADKISGRKGDLIRENKELALETKHMTELHIEVPLEFDLKQGSIDQISWSKLGEFFQKLGFRMLLTRIGKMGDIDLSDNIKAIDNPVESVEDISSNDSIKEKHSKQAEQLGLF